MSVRGMNCSVHDPEVMGSNPGRVDLGAHEQSVQVTCETKGKEVFPIVRERTYLF